MAYYKNNLGGVRRGVVVIMPSSIARKNLQRTAHTLKNMIFDLSVIIFSGGKQDRYLIRRVCT